VYIVKYPRATTLYQLPDQPAIRLQAARPIRERRWEPRTEFRSVRVDRAERLRQRMAMEIRPGRKRIA
jgi:hypothetical protein